MTSRRARRARKRRRRSAFRARTPGTAPADAPRHTPGDPLRVRGPGAASLLPLADILALLAARRLIPGRRRRPRRL